MSILWTIIIGFGAGLIGRQRTGPSGNHQHQLVPGVSNLIV
jgi:hypothetical protein